MDYNKKLKELDTLLNLIEKNNDIDKQLELYEKGKKKCSILENKINKHKNNIEEIEKTFSEDIEKHIDNSNKEDIKNILEEIENIYKKINSDDITVDKIEDFYKESLILKTKAQQFCKNKDLKIENIL